MKKLLISSLIITGLVLASPMAATADNHKECGVRSECSKSEKDSKCLVTKLKGKTKLLWENKEDLGLKDAQLDKIKEIKYATIKQLIRLDADKKIAKVELKSLWYEDVVDVDKANVAIDAKYKAKADSAKVFTKAISDIQNELTKEQRDKWKEHCKASEKGECGKCAKAKFCPLTGKPTDKK